MDLRPPRSRTLALCALVPALALGAGCGGDDDSGGLSGRDKLEVLQARGDITEYCSVQDTGPNDLTDRSLGVMLDAVRDLSRVYRENPDTTLEISVERKSLTMEQLMREQVRALRRCGREGRLQAGVLEAALQQQTAS
jgi:hypothetical protein